SHHEKSEAIGSFLLPCAATSFPCRGVVPSGATPRGQPWTPAVTRPHEFAGLSTRRMAVLWPFRGSSLGRHVHRELLRNAWLDLTPYNTQNCLPPKKLRRDIQ